MIVVPQAAAPEPKRERSSWLQRAVILGTVFVLTVSAATLVFWYYAVTTSAFALAETALYFIRNVGLIGLLIGGILLFAVISAFRRSILPTADLMQAVEQLAGGDYDIELQEQGPREMRSLTRTFNYMVDRLRSREQARRRMFADVARIVQIPHPEDPIQARLIKDWSRLVLAENGELVLHPEPTDLVILTRNTLMNLVPEVGARGATIRGILPNSPLIAELDPVAYSEILTCLVLNGLGRLGPEGEIRVEVNEMRRPAGVQVKVADNGRTPTPGEMECLFTTLRTAPTIGSGLELPLARTLVEAQGGTMTARSEGENNLTVQFIFLFI